MKLQTLFIAFLILFVFSCEFPTSTNNEKEIIFRTVGTSFTVSDSITVNIENKTDSSYVIGLRCNSFLEMYFQRKQNGKWSNNLWFPWMSYKCLSASDTILPSKTFSYTIKQNIFDTIGTYRLVLTDTSIVSNSFEIK